MAVLRHWKVYDFIKFRNVVVSSFAILFISFSFSILSESAVIRETDPRPWFDRGHHDRYTWSRELGDDYVVTETAYAPKGYKFIIMKSRDRELKEHGYKRCTSYYDFTGPKALAVITVKGPKEKRPCLVTSTELNYRAAMADLDDRNGSTSATSLKPLQSVDGTISPLDNLGEQKLFLVNPGLRAVCRGRRVVDTRSGVGNANGDNSRVVQVLLLDTVVNVVQPRRPSRKSSWRGNGPFDFDLKSVFKGQGRQYH